MTHVRLVGPANDGHDLVVSTDGGDEFTLPVTEELKLAVSRADGAGGATPASLSPKEIQRRIRAGFTAEELAELSGTPLPSIQRYEEPILAERAYIAELARACRVSREAGAPTLGEVVTDRLASRGIPAKALAWDAFRVAPEPWRVVAQYRDGAETVEAVWTFDHRAHSLVADDERSRWLTETELLTSSPAPRHLAPVTEASSLDDVPLSAKEARKLRAVAEEPAAESEPVSETARPSTEDLLEDLQAKRGTREIMDVDEDDEEFEGFGPLQAREAEFSVASGGGGLSADPEAGAEGADAGGSSAAPRVAGPRAKRNGRAHVPSWDEIVFGAKGD